LQLQPGPASAKRDRGISSDGWWSPCSPPTSYSPLLYGKLRSDLAGLQQDRATDELADVRATMAKEIADAKAEITLDISAMSADLQQEVNKTNARLDDLTQSSPRSPTSTTPPKPIAKPGRGR
jgi:hypothetical protein